MKRIILSLILILALQGCSIQYHNVKKISADSTNAKTPYGKIDNAKTYFYSTYDMVLGSVIKKDPVPPISNLDFMD